MDNIINILHLEDLPSDATFIKNALIKSKIRFMGLTVDSKEKFITALTEFSPDIILADHSLPSFNSIEALRILKQSKLDIPFIIVTSSMSDEAAVELIMKGADDYILKDRLSRLPVAILNALEKFRLKKEHQHFLDALIKSEKRYRALIEHSTDGVVILNANVKPIYASSSVTNVLGYDTSEILDMNLFTLMYPDDMLDITQMFENILGRFGETMRAPAGRMVHKDGSWRWIEATITNLLHDSAINGLIYNFRDVTEKKALSRLLDKATKLARIGSFEVDVASNLIFWSPMTQQIHEVEHDFVPDTKSALDFYQIGPGKEIMIEAYQSAVAKQTPFDLELPIITAKGNERWIRVIGEVELIGEKCIVSGSFQDVDKMKRAESEVLKAYEEKNIILESIGDAFFAVDKDWVINYWNREAARLLLHPKNKVLNKNLWEVFADSLGAESYEKYKQAVESNQMVHFEDYYQPLNKWLEVSAYPSTNGLSVYIKDITERKLSEKQLNELNSNLQQYTNELVLSNKGLEQFSYMVSHNLRAPVANIIGLAELLSDDTYPADLRDSFLNGILENVKRLDEVIIDLNQILQVKRQISEKNEMVNFQELVDNIQASIQSLILTENVRIITDFEAVNQFVTLKTYLHSIFYNLIKNSIKYHQPGLAPVLEISSKIQNGKLLLSFKDNGLGIDLDKKNGQLFGLYKRFHHHVEGKGMGLFMVKTQVEMLGGSISINSKINEGTTFLIEFKFNTNLANL